MLKDKRLFKYKVMLFIGVLVPTLIAYYYAEKLAVLERGYKDIGGEEMVFVLAVVIYIYLRNVIILGYERQKYIERYRRIRREFNEWCDKRGY